MFGAVRGRRALLESRSCMAPASWGTAMRLAEEVGLRVVPVESVNGVDTGESPGGMFYTRGVVYVDLDMDPVRSVLHEVCHYVVAKNRRKAHRVNYAADVDEEVLTCDAQIVWALVHLGAKEAADIAGFMSYSTANHVTLDSTLEDGMREWARFGRPVEVTPAHRWALALAWGVDTTARTWGKVR